MIVTFYMSDCNDKVVECKVRVQCTRLSPVCQCFHLKDENIQPKIIKSVIKCSTSSNIMIVTKGVIGYLF